MQNLLRCQIKGAFSNNLQNNNYIAAFEKWRFYTIKAYYFIKYQAKL